MLKNSAKQVHPELQKVQRCRRGSVKPILQKDQEIEFENSTQEVPSQIRLITKTYNTTTVTPSNGRKLQRFDQRGNLIIKGNKNHKVTFRREIEDIIFVENWKIYNMDLDDDEDESCPCQLI